MLETLWNMEAYSLPSAKHKPFSILYQCRPLCWAQRNTHIWKMKNVLIDPGGRLVSKVKSDLINSYSNVYWWIRFILGLCLHSMPVTQRLPWQSCVLSYQLNVVTPRECPGSQATASKAPLQQLFGIHVNYTYVKVTIPLAFQNREHIIPWISRDKQRLLYCNINQIKTNTLFLCTSQVLCITCQIKTTNNHLKHHRSVCEPSLGPVNLGSLFPHVINEAATEKFWANQWLQQAAQRCRRLSFSGGTQKPSGHFPVPPTIGTCFCKGLN